MSMLAWLGFIMVIWAAGVSCLVILAIATFHRGEKYLPCDDKEVGAVLAWPIRIPYLVRRFKDTLFK